jgi:hypothetical protein
MKGPLRWTSRASADRFHTNRPARNALGSPGKAGEAVVLGYSVRFFEGTLSAARRRETASGEAYVSYGRAVISTGQLSRLAENY